MLSGKYNDGNIPSGSRFDRMDEFKVDLSWKRVLQDRQTVMTELLQFLASVSERLQCTQAQLALAWCLRNPSVSVVIIGATSVEQLTENIEAVRVAERLSPEVMYEISMRLQTAGH